MKARYKELVDKSVAAMIAAIEVYNKPDFRYREETFSVLAVNSWELLAKAYYLKLNNNQMRYLYIYENKINKDGTKSAKKSIKTNRSGNPQTHSLDKVLKKIEDKLGNKLPTPLTESMNLLIEMRDNTIHFYNKNQLIGMQLQEIGSASLKNYVIAVKEWFDMDLSEYNFYLMPLSFFSIPNTDGLILNKEEENFFSLVEQLDSEVEDTNAYQIRVSVKIDLTRSKGSDAIKAQLSKDGHQLAMTDEQIRAKYPLDYHQMIAKLREIFSDFKQDRKFHELKKTIMNDERYHRSRFLDPQNKKSSKKDFYSVNVLKYFENHYSKNSF